MTSRRSIMTAGYIVLDVVIHGDQLGHAAGGTAGNVAANLAFLNWDAACVGLIGDDPAGRQVVADLRQAGVDTKWMQVDPGASTPVVVEELTARTHRFRFGCPHCGRRFPRFRAAPEELASRASADGLADVFFFDRPGAASLLLARRHFEAGKLVMFEPSVGGKSEDFAAALRYAHVVKYSQERMQSVERLLTWRNRQLHIRTTGAAGIEWATTRNAWRASQAFDVDVVDTCGAGDWTSAALLAALPSLDPRLWTQTRLSETLRTAQAWAAVSCGAIGSRGIARTLTLSDGRRQVASVLRGARPDRRLTSAPVKSRRKAGCAACLASATS